MKILIIAISLLLSLSAYAGGNGSYLSCVNGTIWEVGDGHFQVDLLDDHIAFYMYETSFNLDASQVETSISGPVVNKYRFVNQKVAMSSEGTHYTGVVSGLFIISDDEKSATVDLSINNGELYVYKLKCTRNIVEGDI